MKSTNISSATGLKPAAAAPTAAPMKPDSLIGVSSTRVGPNFECRPLVTPSGPPQASCSPGEPVPPETSSPIRMTRGSRVISWVSASLIACRKESFLAIVLLRSIGFVDVGQQRLRLRIGSRLGLGNRALDEVLRLGVDLVELRRLEQPGLAHPSPEEGQAVLLVAQLLDLVLAAIGLGVALEMAVIAVELELQQRRAVAVAGPLDRLLRRLVHGEEIMAVDDLARHAEA